MQSLYSKKQLPSDCLANFIDAYWVVKNTTDKSVKMPIVPDGCIDIIYKNGEILLVGMMEIALLVSIEPNDYYFGIRFKPAIIASLLNKDISQFNDKIIPLEEVDVKLYENLKDKIEDIDKLNHYFEKLFSDICLDKRILCAVETIELHGGNITIEKVCEKTNLSKKQLERLFVIHVGLTPKRFARIIRFFHTHKFLSQEGIVNLCMKVLEKGYYDQAHFNREYKLLTGLNPTHEVMSIFYNTKK